MHAQALCTRPGRGKGLRIRFTSLALKHLFVDRDAKTLPPDLSGSLWLGSFRAWLCCCIDGGYIDTAGLVAGVNGAGSGVRPRT